MVSVFSELLCFIKAIFIIPIIHLLFSPLFIWRIIVKCLAKCFKPNLATMYNSKDNFFVLTEPSIYNSPQVINSMVIVFKGQLSIDDIKLQLYQNIVNSRSKMNPTVLIYDKLQQHPKQWLGYTFYEWDEQFDINQHVKVIKNVNINTDICEFVSSTISSPFNETRSLWDVTYLPNFNTNTNPNSSLIFFRFHHSICDGFILFKLISNSIMGFEPCSLPLFRTKSVEDTHEDWCSKFAKIYKNTIGVPYLFVQAMKKISQTNMENAWQIAHKSVVQSPVSIPKKILCASTRRISLEDFSMIKKKFKIPFTSIINTIISNALNNYFDKNYNGCTQNIDSLQNIWHLFPLFDHPAYQLTNSFGSASIPMSLQCESLVEQLQSAKQEYSSARDSHPIIQLTINYIWRLMGTLPSSLYIKLLGESIATIATVVNVGGCPSTPTHSQETVVKIWDNNEVQDIIFTLSPTVQTGLIFSIISFNGYLKINISADNHCIESIDKLNEIIIDIETELQKILQLVHGTTNEKYSDEMYNNNSFNETPSVIWV